MSSAIPYRGVVIENVPDAPWMIAYGRRSSGTTHFAVMRACPDYTSDELRLACWDSLVADVFGVCDLCGAVASTPPEIKTAPPGQSFLGTNPMPHRSDCPCAGERLQELDCRDSPDGLGTLVDFSEQSTDALAAFLRMAMTPLRVLNLVGSGADSEAGPDDW